MVGKKQQLVDELFEYLKEKGANPRKLVTAGNRIADIVTDEAVYEVVANADAEVIQTAVPHVLASRNELDPSLKSFIYGFTSGEDLTAAIEAASKWGVTVMLVREGEKPGP